MERSLHYSILCVFFFFSLFSCKKQQGTIVEKKAISTHTTPENISVSNDVLKERLFQLKNDSFNITFKNKDSILAFYSSRKAIAAWTSVKGRNNLFYAIKNADKEGLTPDDYNLKAIEKVINSDPFSNNDNVAIDLLFTDTYLSYTYHLANGKINPAELYDDWEIKPNVFSYNAILENAINQNSLLESFEHFKPKHLVYQQLKKTLPKIKALVCSDSLKTVVLHGDKIRPNKNNNRVINIRKRLNELLFLPNSLVNNSKVLDTLLQESVRKFQASKKLKTDAIIGKETINALNESYEDKYNSVLANLERWRWYPRDLGNEYLLVNIPNYQLNYVAPETNSVHKIIVGRTDRKTPVFSSHVIYFDFNPKWYVPPTIKKEDIIPAATKDIDYLRRKNISVYNKQGEQMQLDSINWNSTAPLSYRYVQGSGSSNALGLVKIIFPNKFSVYLHDTPSKSLFNKNYRSRSSGCVRVQNVFQLPNKILNLPMSKIDAIIKKGETKRIHINKKINVHFFYWSVVFNENSTPVYLNDVYNLDKKLVYALTN